VGRLRRMGRVLRLRNHKRGISPRGHHKATYYNEGKVFRYKIVHLINAVILTLVFQGELVYTA
jgi:hypothetical protein